MNSDQIQSISLPFNSNSLVFQSIIGCALNVQLFLLHTSLAKSISKPVYSPFASLYPNGGNSALNPTIKVSSVFLVFDSSLKKEGDSKLIIF